MCTNGLLQQNSTTHILPLPKQPVPSKLEWINGVSMQQLLELQLKLTLCLAKT